MYLGYNTNGLMCHDPEQAVHLLAETGYKGIGITIDHQWLNPFASGFARQLERISALLRQVGFRTVIETGARFLLDSRRKHEPTLVSESRDERDRRVRFLCQCIDIAGILSSDCVSLWSGIVPDSLEHQAALDRLCRSLEPVIEYAAARNVRLGFEPEPGMLIDTLSSFAFLHQRFAGDTFRLTMDIGHLHCLGEIPLAERIREWSGQLVNVHIEDMKTGVHDHLMFGEGEIDFVPVMEELRRCGYDGGVFVELSRHSHDAVRAVQRSFQFLSGLCEAAGPQN